MNVKNTEHDFDEGLPEEELGELVHHPMPDILPEPRVSFMHCPNCGKLHTNKAEQLRCMDGQ